MISICIPIHNYYAYPLVRRLVNQIHQMKFDDDFEIVCIDDYSTGYNFKQNKGIGEIATYLRLEENVGTAKTRNLFLKYTQGEWLLFLDADSLIPQDFLSNYKKVSKSDASVIVGGREYDKSANDAEHKLHYLFGKKNEVASLDIRRANPYKYFLSCNFMIRREMLERNKFDSFLDELGCDDAIYAYGLQQKRIPILHIENSVTCGNVETNAEFLHNTVIEVENLVKAYDILWEDQRLCHSLKLLCRYATIRNMHLQGFVNFLFKLFNSLLESHFVGGKAITLSQFEFYRLAIFIRKMHYSED